MALARGVALGVAGLWVCGAVTTAAATMRISQDSAAGQVKVLYHDRPLLVYQYTAHPYKPYVKALFSLQGDNVLLDAPPDHLHHHGLMFAVKVNGTNFWEEARNPGVEKPLGPPKVTTQAGEGAPAQAELTQTIDWVAQAHRDRADTWPVALLREQRRLVLGVHPEAKEVALLWQSRFTVGPAAPEVRLTGADYHGLGLRLPEAWNHVARHENSEGLPYSAEQKWDVLPARWSKVSCKLGGREVTVVMCNTPRNPGPSRFFSMLNPFTYLSATQSWSRKPQVYRAGQSFTLQYLVLVYPEAPSRRALEQRYARWVKETAP